MLLYFCAALLAYGLGKFPAPSMVVGSSPHIFAPLAGLAVARMSSSPFVLDVRDIWTDSIDAIVGGRARLLLAPLKLLENFLYRRADKITSVLPFFDAHLAARRINKPFTHIPNGYDAGGLEGDHYGAHRHILNDAVVDKSRELKVVYAGAIGPANSIEELLSLWARVSERNAEITLDIYGDGPARAACESIAKTLNLASVTFYDFIQKEKLRSVLSDYHVGIIYITDRGMYEYGISPNKIFDYLGANLPVLQIGKAELLPDGKKIEYIEQLGHDASAVELAQALYKLINYKTNDKVRRWAEDAVSYSSLARKFEEVIG